MVGQQVARLVDRQLSSRLSKRYSSHQVIGSILKLAKSVIKSSKRQVSQVVKSMIRSSGHRLSFMFFYVRSKKKKKYIVFKLFFVDSTLLAIFAIHN